MPLFEPAALEALLKATSGLPRKVNPLAHHALMATALASDESVERLLRWACPHSAASNFVSLDVLRATDTLTSNAPKYNKRYATAKATEVARVAIRATIEP